MQFLPFLILATMVLVVLTGPYWFWWKNNPAAAPYGSGLNFLALFALACEILWLVFGAGSGCAHV
jgi:hypothetical protein